MLSRYEIIDILEHHEIETAALERQIVALGQALESDLEEIRSRVYPGAMAYDQEKIQATPKPTDEKLVSMVQALDERREQHKRNVDVILARLREIRTVYAGIQRLGAVEKATLLNLYYPRRTMEDVAEMMGVDRGTIRNRRDTAIIKLEHKLKGATL